LLNNESKTAQDNTFEILQTQLSDIKKLIEQLMEERNKLDDWITEKEAIRISGLCRSTLLTLRKQGDLTSSTLSGKQNFYRLSDFNKLLETNEQKR
jgi:hypothetical protein